MAPATAAQASSTAMASPEIQPAAGPMLPVIDLEFVKLFEGNKKLKNASFAAYKHTYGKRKNAREEQNQRGVRIIPYGPFCIRGGHGTTWHTDIRKGTSHALAFADHFDTLYPHPAGLTISLEQFHPLYIDRMYHMMHYDWYSMSLPRRLQHVDQECKNEDPWMSMTYKCKAELHFWMAMLADTVRYADMKTFAIGELQAALIQDEILSVHVFGELISQVFREGILGIKDDDRRLRLIMVTYGAFCDPVWRQQQPETHGVLTEDNGPDSYGYWHQKAFAALSTARERELPSKILRLLDKSDSSGPAIQPRILGIGPSRAQKTAPVRVQIAATQARKDTAKAVQREPPTREGQPSAPTRRQTKAQIRAQRVAQSSPDQSSDIRQTDDADETDNSADATTESQAPSPGLDNKDKTAKDVSTKTGLGNNKEQKDANAQESQSTTNPSYIETSNNSKPRSTSTGNASDSIKAMSKHIDTVSDNTTDMPPSIEATSVQAGIAFPSIEAESSRVKVTSTSIEAVSMKTGATQASSNTQRPNDIETTGSHPSKVQSATQDDQKLTSESSHARKDTNDTAKDGVAGQKVRAEDSIYTDIDDDTLMGDD